MRPMRMKMSRETRKLFQKKRSFSPVFLLVSVLLLVLLVSAVIYDNSRIALDTLSFCMPTMEKNMEGYSILQLSDIHDYLFGDNGERLEQVLGTNNYDLVVMTGDLTGTDGSTQGFYQALDYFAAKGKPVYFIAGEEDPAASELREDGSFGPSAWIQGAQERGAIYLDVPVAVAGEDTKLWLLPASAMVLDTENAVRSLEQRLEKENLSDSEVESILYKKARYTAFAEAMAQRQHNDLNVMLSHMPCLDTSLQADSATQIFSEADLILAGHYLGGQYRLPFIGPLYINDDSLPHGGWFPGDDYVRGLQEVNATNQYISTGLGARHARPFNFRLWNTPQVSIIRLTRKLGA